MAQSNQALEYNLGEPLVREFLRIRHDLRRFLKNKFDNQVDVQDILQETYLKIQGLPEGTVGKLDDRRAYIYRVAVNLMIDRYRRQARHRRFEAETDVYEVMQVASSAPGPEQIAVDRQWLYELGKAMQSLSPKCRAALLMHRCQGLTYEQVGQQLGISASMVKKYISQGLATCRAKMKARDS